MPSSSPRRGARVVADTLSSSSGTRSRRVRISVPLPTPDGPVMTKTRATAPGYDDSPTAPLATQHGDQLGALALRQATDRLARRDPALLQDLVRLHAAVLGNREQHVEDLRGLHVLGRLPQKRVNRHPARLQILLQLRPPRADRVGALERVHALKERSLGCRRVL